VGHVTLRGLSLNKIKSRDSSNVWQVYGRPSISTRWPACPRPNPQARVHLFCFPYAGGRASIFHTNGIPKEVLKHPELMQLLIPTLWADFAVCETYTYTSDAPIDCSISAFGGLQDHHVSRERLEAWRDQSRASFSLCMFPGNHFFLHTAEPLFMKAIAQVLQQLVRMIT
jgi:medium-chain acyl-[acyl-carrier-protein] hydrolase